GSPSRKRKALRALKAEGYKSIVALMHAYKFPAHEIEIARIASDMGFEQVSVSHEVSPLIKLVGAAIRQSWMPIFPGAAPLCGAGFR
ncbi:hydantoinase/oxoprolinase N-terminal domain-containing protein, partial [Brucella abortus]|nr:hydantoinase/oxoprolinase N-terminal domain-containing protein [Brucella abortus]